MLPEQQQRILGYFIEEAKDHLNTIEQGLLALQNTIDDPEMLKEVYRAAHSIKGGAGMLGISSIQKTSHLLEDCFKILEGSPVRVDQKLEELFLGVFDTLQSLVDQLQGPFGLTEDVAAGLMSTIAPVFSELQQHLDVLTKQPAAASGAKAGAGAAAKNMVETLDVTSLQQAFKQEVMEQLRQMLQLFKPPQWPNSRQDLASRCESLQELGTRFNLPGWSELLSIAARAIANLENTSQTLAPIVIKEIKQAQELVLAGRGNQVKASEQLAALQPPAPTPEEAIASDLENLLAATGDTDDADWFQSALAEAPAAEAPSEAEELFGFAGEPADDAAQFFFVPETEVAPPKTTPRSDRSSSEKPSITAPADPTGPEVGAAELIALNDLFPEEVPELDSTWQVEEVMGDADSQPLLESLDDFNVGGDNELADLFADGSAEFPQADAAEEDDTVTLFGKTFDFDDSEDEPVAPQGAARENRLTDDPFQDLAASGTASPQDEDLSLFGENFFFDESASDPVAAQTAAATENRVTDDLFEDLAAPETAASAPDEDLSLFGEDFFFEESASAPLESQEATAANTLTDDLFEDLAAPETAASAPDEDLSLFGEDFFFEESASDPVGATVPSPTGTSEMESEGLSELFAGLNEDDFWQAESNESENLGLATEESPDFSSFADSNWLQESNNEAIAAPVADELDLAGFDWSGELSTPEDDNLTAAAPDLTPTQLNSEDSQSDLAGATLDRAFGDADFEFSSPEDGAEAFEFPALTDDFDASNLFETEAATETPQQQSGDVDLEFGSLPTNDYPSATNTEATFDDFFSLDQASQMPADAELEALDLFGDMESTVFPELNMGLEQDAQMLEGIPEEGDFDLFAQDESAAGFDLFDAEAEAAAQGLEIADNLTPEELPSFELAAADSATEADDDLGWLSEITQDVDGEDELAFGDEETAAGAGLNLAAANEPISFDQLDVEPASTPSELAAEADFGDLEAMLGADAAVEVAAPAESEASFDLDFDDLEAMLGADAAVEVAAATESEASFDLDFDDLEAMLGEEAIAPTSEAANLNPPPAVSNLPSTPAKVADKEFEDLEAMLVTAAEMVGPPMKTRPGQVSTSKPRARIFEQTMKVPVKQLDNLTNLVGELVVNRNSLEQDQERLRQFLDNLLHQVQQLSDVGARMQDLYERSLLESALLASRQSYRFSTSTTGDLSNGYSSSSTWDHIEMDRFTPFHTLSQEMIELIVRVRESASDIEFIVDETDQVSRQFRQVTTQLQEGLTRARMVPFAEIERVFPLFRYVRDKAAELGKQAELRIEGRETLIDKLILEHLSDPMKHLINNGLAHGIESPEVRQRQGKPPVGRITISAFHQGNQTVISFSDDGAGIDVDRLKAKAVEKRLITPDQAKNLSRIEAYELLYLSGLSTKDKADLIAGKGVGMDVVRTNVSEIRGTITTDSTQGKGTSFTIRLPLTLSICKALCCVSDQALIAFPMDGVEDALDVPITRVQVNAEGENYIQWRDMQLTFKHLNELLAFNRQMGRGRVYGASKDEDSVAIVVLRSAGNFLAIQVDRVVGEQEIVIKQLEGPVPKPIGIAGATVMGDGRIMPIGDVLELIDIAMGRVGKDRRAMLWEQNNLAAVSEAPVTEPRVLIVDDSITVRELLSMTFNKAGYRVEQARDGQEAWDKLKSGLPCDIVFCDIEMPRMDGLELLSRLHKDPDLTHLPVAMLTSRGAEKHRQMAFDLGASGYFTKPYLEEALLDAASRMLKGEKLVTSNVSASS